MGHFSQPIICRINWQWLTDINNLLVTGIEDFVPARIDCILWVSGQDGLLRIRGRSDWLFTIPCQSGSDSALQHPGSPGCSESVYLWTESSAESVSWSYGWKGNATDQFREQAENFWLDLRAQQNSIFVRSFYKPFFIKFWMSQNMVTCTCPQN